MGVGKYGKPDAPYVPTSIYRVLCVFSPAVRSVGEKLLGFADPGPGDTRTY